MLYYKHLQTLTLTFSPMNNRYYYSLCTALLLTQACTSQQENITDRPTQATAAYLDSSGREDEFSGGARMITISTPKGDYKVWTKRVGNNPRMKVLLLHGGPGGTHEAFECFDSYLPKEGIEYYYYDQLAPTTATNLTTPAFGTPNALWRKWSR
ncbi:hypothetical protein GCM10028895_02250 [Pontibacter rugosus]